MGVVAPGEKKLQLGCHPVAEVNLHVHKY